jgi:BirA family transcriptional regulator, biotin operon repressor / biotin---[acetyl-CoA-carboxylase] ligase
MSVYSVLPQKSVRNADIYLFDVIDSTSAWLKKNKDNCAPFTCVWALEQTNGYGRLGRTWHSETQEGLWFSILIPAQELIGIELRFPQVVAWSLLEWIQSFFPNQVPSIKWPNDLMCGEAKLAGILLEKSGDFFVLGVGVNLNSNSARDEQIGRKTIGLRDLNISTSEVELMETYCKILTNTLWIYQKKGFAHFLSDLKKMNCLFGRVVKVPENGIEGVVVDLSEQGALILQLETDEFYRCFESEVYVIS